MSTLHPYASTSARTQPASRPARRSLLLSAALLVGALLLPLSGCYNGSPTSWIPGRYKFARAGYHTTLDLNRDGTSLEVRTAPDGSVRTVPGHWHPEEMDGHVSIDPILPFYPESDVDMAVPAPYTPQVDIVWGHVCLLVNGNEDVYMCKPW